MFTLRSQLFKKYIDNSYIFHNKINSSILIRNIANEIPVIHHNLIEILVLITETLILVGITLLLLYINFEVSLIILSIVLLIIIIFYLSTNEFLKNLGGKKIYHTGQYFKQFMQALGNIKIIKILGNPSYYFWEY